MENLLCRHRLFVKEHDLSFLCFSHVVDHPKDVKEWIPVQLPEFPKGETIMFDRRSAESLEGDKGFEVILNPKTNQILMIRISRI